MYETRVLSGMRPTGSLHLGHYHGVLKNWARLQAEYLCLFFVADWHALTTDYASPGAVAENTTEMVLDWLAVGLDPARCTIFQQSAVKEHAELGKPFWHTGDRPMSPAGGIDKGYMATARLDLPDDGYRASNPQLRLDDMDLDGIHASVIYGPGSLFGFPIADQAQQTVDDGVFYGDPGHWLEEPDRFLAAGFPRRGLGAHAQCSRNRRPRPGCESRMPAIRSAFHMLTIDAATTGLPAAASISSSTSIVRKLVSPITIASASG